MYLNALFEAAIQNAISSPESLSQSYLRMLEAEQSIADYISALSVTPGMNPLLISEQVQMKRAEYGALALRRYLADISPVMGLQLADAVKTWLTAHSQGQYIPGSLVAGPSPVTPVGGFSAHVAMNFSE